MFKVVVYICLLSVSPNACDRTTALTTLESEPMRNSLECLKSSQEWLAKLAVKPELNAEYPKVSCERIKLAQQDGASNETD